jgi:hypothetical protein
MRGLTDDEIARGLASFEDTWPVRHPMHCAICERALTDAHGTALVEIWITERQWRCATCTEARHG